MIATIIIILTIILVLVLALKTGILRDPNSCSNPVQRNTYSLGRTQLMLWTTIVFCSYIYLVTKTDWQDIKFTESVALLLGISAGTTVISRSIDKTSGVTQKNSSGTDGCSKGFIIDILSDREGISVHRFQQVIFTLLLVYVYLSGLIINKNFPDLDNYLLVLAGVSAGGYLGVKINEK
ncbi:hypothetical protein QQ020_14170 [Fulvivirgaceae bacterium BMA12]|uniref:Uncharacterized protein n=1 Tax=Agaribacillus aureus TaxID=3051825 RepID=A0ABT8L626_9BACT|nr:hypothetical protein [Fulvivirgaceae bacterium BMA12]